MVFAFHGYPWLIHRLTYRRTNHDNFHVRGYREEGTTTTPFDMCVLNGLDRFSLVGEVIDRVPSLAPRAGYAKQAIRDALIDHRRVHQQARRRRSADSELAVGRADSHDSSAELHGRRQRLRSTIMSSEPRRGECGPAGQPGR